MDQDVTHAVTAPSDAAGTRPRYSMVLKLVLHPIGGAAGDAPQQPLALAPKSWGVATPFGSAAAPPASIEDAAEARTPADEFQRQAAEREALREKVRQAAAKYYQ